MSQFLVVFAQPDLLSSVKYGIWTKTLRLLLKDKQRIEEEVQTCHYLFKTLNELLFLKLQLCEGIANIIKMGFTFFPYQKSVISQQYKQKQSY